MTNSPDRPGDEPTLSGEEWVEYGGEVIWAVDGWARAKALLALAFEACSSPVADVEIDRVKKIGEGLFRKVYAAHVDLSPDPDNLTGTWAVLLPDRKATQEDCRRWVREVAVLGQLAREQLPFRVPDTLGAFPDGDRPAIIRRFIDGIPVDLRAPAREWTLQHLPQDRAAVLVHGDLLGQNILVFPDEAPAVIDWEFCRMGDPAFDLAIVTRGLRRPFQMARGLDRLLDAYSAAGGDPIKPSEVHFYELCLAAGWYREALQGRGSEPAEQALAKLIGILRRAEESTR